MLDIVKAQEVLQAHLLLASGPSDMIFSSEDVIEKDRS